MTHRVSLWQPVATLGSVLLVVPRKSIDGRPHNQGDQLLLGGVETGVVAGQRLAPCSQAVADPTTIRET